MISPKKLAALALTLIVSLALYLIFDVKFDLVVNKYCSVVVENNHVVCSMSDYKAEVITVIDYDISK